MSLFKISQLKNAKIDEANIKKYSGTDADLKLIFTKGVAKSQISEIFPSLVEQKSIFFHTEGAWSNIDLIEHVLSITGPAEVFFTTWSIGEIEIRRFVYWQENKIITNLSAIMDTGIRNRKPEIYQQIIQNIKCVKFAKCHAKISVIKNEKFSITIMGSANFTKNPRIETGIVINNYDIAEANIEWILKIINND